MTNNMTYIQNSNIVVLWSGGLDSTYLLHHILTKKEYLETNVCAISVIPNFITKDKMVNEQKARNRYLTDVVSKLDREKFVNHEIELLEVPALNATRNLGGVQLAYWIQTVYPFVSHNACIMVSAIKGDDQLMFVKECEELVAALNKFYNKEVTVCFPLTLFTKEDIVISANEFGILDYTWSCEEGAMLYEDQEVVSDKQCKKCKSCHDHIIGSMSAASFANTDTNINDYVKEHFDIEVVKSSFEYSFEALKDRRPMTDIKIKEKCIIVEEKKENIMLLNNPLSIDEPPAERLKDISINDKSFKVEKVPLTPDTLELILK